jgi:hypothetical protein
MVLQAEQVFHPAPESASFSRQLAQERLCFLQPNPVHDKPKPVTGFFL